MGKRIESYVEFNTDALVIRAGEPGNWTEMKISRYEIEDGKHLARLRFFVESLMCGSKGSAPVAKPADWNGYSQDLDALVRKAMEDNQYKAEFKMESEMCASKGYVPAPPTRETAELMTQFEQKADESRNVDLRRQRIIDTLKDGDSLEVSVPAVEGRILDVE